MSLNFSDDEDTYEPQVGEGEKKQKWSEEHFGEENENDFEATVEEGVEEQGAEPVEEVKKKKKTSLGFHLKNVFNDVALKRVEKYIKKKRKRQCLETGEEFFDDEEHEDDASNEEEGDENEGDLERYVREEQKRLADMIPEKDEFWEMYIYLNLKKKKRKIEYDPTYYSNAFKKILENLKKDYIKIIEEHLFKNEKLREYFITTDVADILTNLPNNIFQMEKFLKARVIQKCYNLSEMNRKLTDLFNKGTFCNYVTEVNMYNQKGLTGDSGSYGYRNDGYFDIGMNQNREKDGEEEMEQEKKDNEFHRSLSTSVIRERENVNMLLKKLYEKYVDIISKVKRHQRSELRSNFNLFMNLINEVTSKLYFNIHNVLVTDENLKIADIYKTIRRKYNIHDVLAKVQKLTQKREVYEVYRSYLLYKYKTTEAICDDAFKNHIMQDNVNVFNFKKFYNTDFSEDVQSIIKDVKEKEDSDEEEAEDEGEVGMHGLGKERKAAKDVKGEFNKQRKYPVDESYKNDVYTDDFFNIDKGSGRDRENINTYSSKVEVPASNEHATTFSKYVNKEKRDNSLVASPRIEQTNNGKTEKSEHKEETPLERAKRIAREKKKMLLEAKSKII